MTPPAPGGNPPADPSDPFGIARAGAAALTGALGVSGFDTAVFAGSGWQPAFELLAEPVASVGVGELGAGFSVPSVEGHLDRLDFVAMGGRRVLVCHGRVHLYEGHPAAAVAHPVRVAAMAGCTTAVFTNASGTLADRFSPGDFVVVSDHLNLTGRSPASGPILGGQSPGKGRFVELVGAYSPRLRALAGACPEVSGEGVYAAMPGPHLETPAEVRMLRILGADLVGMSTVVEVIAARQMALEVLALSLVTNRCVPENPPPGGGAPPGAGAAEPASFGVDDVLSVGRERAVLGAALLRSVVEGLP